MAQEHTEQAAHGEHPDVHLPDPSIWPLVVGLAAMFLGAALVWWQRDSSSDLAPVAVGAAAVFTLFAAAGWAYEDGRMRAKAESGEIHGPRNPRFNQVVTFAIPEGALALAGVENGVLGEIEQTDGPLHDLAGFQDLRITVSPSDTGPSQVLVETTWSGREELATYDESRQTMLDILARHEDQVVPGSVQVFDMEVVRDTKDMSFRFGWGAASTVIGSLVVGGFMIGAGLSLFQEEGTAAGGGGATPPPAADPYAVIAKDNFFNTKTLQAPPNTAVSFTLTNEGKIPHNLAFYQSKGGAEIKVGNILQAGGTEQIAFTTPAAGTYYFQCDIHPSEMFGTFEVKEGAPPPGGTTNGGGGATAGAITVKATDNKFDKSSIDAKAAQEFSVTLQNDGKVPHNIHFLDKKGGTTLADGAEGAILQSGKSETLKFTPPTAGKYYFQCDVHPTEMFGDFNVS